MWKNACLKYYKYHFQVFQFLLQLIDPYMQLPILVLNDFLYWIRNHPTFQSVCKEMEYWSKAILNPITLFLTIQFLYLYRLPFLLIQDLYQTMFSKFLLHMFAYSIIEILLCYLLLKLELILNMENQCDILQFLINLLLNCIYFLN